MVLVLVDCTHKPKTRLTEVEVAKPVRADVPIYSEWIGTTVGYCFPEAVSGQIPVG
jgi:hypothetical protein